MAGRLVEILTNCSTIALAILTMVAVVWRLSPASYRE
jgi:hypothetical protein